MTTKRLALLLAVLLGSLSTVFLLPKQLGFQPVGINLELPQYMGRWIGKDLEVSDKERTTLGLQTEFSRKRYTSIRGDNVTVSIVLAGQDMMQSIHRPERCLMAQGWTPGASNGRVVDVPGFGKLDVTRLRNSRKVQLQESGPYVQIENVCYYWFVGATDMVGTHYKRLAVDAKDRIFHGYNQRWAMILVSGEITDHLDRVAGRTEAQTDASIQEVIKQFVPKIVAEHVPR